MPYFFFCSHANKIKELLAQVQPLFNVLPNAKTAKIGTVHFIFCLVCWLYFFNYSSNSCQLGFSYSKRDGFADWVVCRVYWLGQKIRQNFLAAKNWGPTSYMVRTSKYNNTILITSCLYSYSKQGSYQKSLKVLSPLLLELKRFDDKLLLLEVQLIESRVHFKLMNIAKSKVTWIIHVPWCQEFNSKATFFMFIRLRWLLPVPRPMQSIALRFYKHKSICKPVSCMQRRRISRLPILISTNALRDTTPSSPMTLTSNEVQQSNH